MYFTAIQIMNKFVDPRKISYIMQFASTSHYLINYHSNDIDCVWEYNKVIDKIRGNGIALSIYTTHFALPY